MKKEPRIYLTISEAWHLSELLNSAKGLVYDTERSIARSVFEMKLDAALQRNPDAKIQIFKFKK